MISTILSLFVIFGEFAPLPTISLQHKGDAFPIQKCAPMPEGVLVFREDLGRLMVFGNDGSFKYAFGNTDGANILEFTSYVTWVQPENLFYAYDIAKQNFTAWSPGGKLEKTLKVDYEIFFDVRRLIPVSGGYVAGTSLSEDKWLLAKMDKNLKIEKKALEIFDADLVELTPDLRRSFCTFLDKDGGRIYAMQGLAPNIWVYDTGLNLVGESEIKLSTWWQVKLGKLKNVSRNPKALSRYVPKFSEVIALTSISDSMLMVGFRNVGTFKYFTYQCFDPDTGEPVGKPLTSYLRFVGSQGNKIYLANPESWNMQLAVFEYRD